ncbi:MAG: multifunctional oxoglutarate decarboxylase/oxoglutarate dehydrogenase thiamine pyrophosphate-binding subunit/dihydrolipoyllysine-residue succinyltransferase subunit [Bacteroidota bacterium]|nr:multifunctional oxoglutarate decarboxylase/oxoglutarate dehydrogenase thiamine pyrophosphate-binding subunit/dihydrolipoyllysine-residue succinyltransferase subunit [Bacteroidota bacterium]
MSANAISEKFEQVLQSFGPNTSYVWDVLQQYLDDPASVNETWQQLFAEVVASGTVTIPAKKKSEVVATNGNHGVPPVTAPVQKISTEVVHKQLASISGVAAKIVDNMEASLALPTATSLRIIPVKVLDENRSLLNKYLLSRSRGKISYTHIVAWAIVKALKKYPNINGSFARVEGQPFRDQKPEINIGIAVDMTRKDGTRTLLVPNIKNVGEIHFDEFVERYDSIIDKARKSALDPSDFQGTSITLTNPGTVGTVSSTPRLMPGQGAIIATGMIGYDAAHQGMSSQTLSALGVSKVMNITCTYDHRVIQGAESGQFLEYIHSLLLGEEKFYDLLFADLHIPFSPVVWSPDIHSVSVGGTGTQEYTEKQARVQQLINAYRVRGHLIAHLDPLVDEPKNFPELDPGYYGLTVWDLDREFLFSNKEGYSKSTLREILDILYATYCGSIGVEFMNIQDPEQKKWLIQKMEPSHNRALLTRERKIQILKKLIHAEGFERYLHTKFVGHKRFSLEGAESFVSIVDVVLDELADHGAERVVIGMAHRGRLNILANTIGKSLAKIFSEFEGNIDPTTIQGSGDVKYHLGAHGIHKTLNGKDITVEVAPNPSHLEAVNPVVEGMVRAMQDRTGDKDRTKAIPILVHGDAAFAGQGIIAEILNLSQLKGYRVGGTIHIIINNQIGFTTSPDDARSTPYCTDVAKMVQAPIFHVNGDNPEACARVAMLAVAYRNTFKKDVVIDMFCYRKYGHNEGDEPSYTQPLLYKKIKSQPSTREIYADRLMLDKEITREEFQQMMDDAKARFERAHEASQKREMHMKAEIALAVTQEQIEAMQPFKSTAVSFNDLREVATKLGSTPPDFFVNQKLVKMLEHRHTFDENSKIDWGFAEALAFGTLAYEGNGVRLSGEDVGRGTFSHRHAKLYDANTGEEFVPLEHVRDGQGKFYVFDSLLSEYAILGFEFGYSVADPLSLVIWEAQFGDFANGAQVIIDQFLAASEAKWQQPCDLVLLLPHGYEGQGPEHSSARLERYLQLCAEDNMQVCNVSTPAQYFHVLRRQMRDAKRRPLVMMAPKSLLRHPMVVSHANEFTEGGFQEVIDDASVTAPANVKRIVLCSGKIYYDAMQMLHQAKNENLAVVRLEQFYPYPQNQLKEIFAKYSNATDVVWMQEEPKNMGAWNFLADQFRDDVLPAQKLRYSGRTAAASTATGSLKHHQMEQESILKDALM